MSGFKLLIQALLQAIVSILLVPLAVGFWVHSFFAKCKNAVQNPKVIVITGASGLGKSLALGYSKPGVIVGLMGRSISRLKEVADACEKKGAIAKILVADVMDRKQMSLLLAQFNSDHPVDILIANAGVSSGTVVGDPTESFNEVFHTNSTGVINTVLPILNEFQTRRKGQIVIMGSLAGFVGSVSSSAPYCASKAAVESLAYTWRMECKPFGVGVTLITPGFVKTPLTDQNDFSMPLIMPADEATKIMMDGISQDYAVVFYPAPIAWASWLVNIIPADFISIFL